VADRYNDVVQSCSKEHCDPFTGDSTEHRITWRGSPDVPAGPDPRVRWRKLRFFLKDAELFSFRFTDAQEGILPDEA
jgi:hypothetical protein